MTLVNNPALSVYRPLAGAKARLVAFPHAGGGASAFSKLRLALEEHGFEVCALQPPQRENRSSHRPHGTVEALVDEFLGALKSLPPLPTAFVGHSYGGLVAFLVAQAMDCSVHAPLHLVASACKSPHTRQGQGCLAHDDVYRTRILALGGIPKVFAADPDLLAMFEQGIIADMKCADLYQHRPSQPLNCRITVYSGMEDANVPPHLAPSWQSLTRYPLSTRSFAGNHFFLYKDPTLTASALIKDIGWIVARKPVPL